MTRTEQPRIAGGPIAERAAPERSPAAALQRSLGNRRLLQLRRALQRRGGGPEWAREQLGVTAESEHNVEQLDAAEAAADPGALPGGGRALDPELRSWAEDHVGGELSDVRVIEGADAVCAPIQAMAFATPGATGGNEVYLSSAVDLGSDDGRFTLLHELAHVRQQRDGRTAGLDGLGGDETLRDALEHEADAVGHRGLGGT